jgi:hypothetical protein
MNNIFAECFLPLKDPRIDRTKKHYLLDIIAISICGILSGAENWEEIEDFGKGMKTSLNNFWIYLMAYHHMIRYLVCFLF